VFHPQVIKALAGSGLQPMDLLRLSFNDLVLAAAKMLERKEP